MVQASDADTFVHAFAGDERALILGGGSNTLFLEDYTGTIIINQIKGLTSSATADGTRLRVGAGENWHQFVITCLQNHWYGLENLALIPGSVGAAPIQNIGAYGVEVGQFIECVSGVYLESGEPFSLRSCDCAFGYRDSVFKHALAGKVVITEVEFFLPRQHTVVATYGELKALDNPTPEVIFENVVAIRRKKLPDPAVTGNAGSFFKNPVIRRSHYDALCEKTEVPGYVVDDEHIKVPAAWFIDQQGFKGYCVGDACCHPNQPLVLVNRGQAKGADVLTLAREIQQRVADQYEVSLEAEVRLVGREGLITL